MRGCFLRFIVAVCWLIAVCAVGPAGSAFAQAAAGGTGASARPTGARIAFDERLAEAPVLAGALRGTLPRADGGAGGGRGVPGVSGIPVMARIVVDRREIEADAAGGALRFERLDERLALYHDRQIPVWLALDAGAGGAGTGDAGTGAGADASPEASARLFRALAPRLAGRVHIVELIAASADGSAPDASADAASAAGAATAAATVDATVAATVDATVLDLKRAAVELRAANPDIVIALGATRQATQAGLERLYTPDVAAYLDAVVIRHGDSHGQGTTALDAARALLDRVDRTAVVYEQGAALSGAPDAAARAFVTGELWRLGTASILASYDTSSDIARAALAQAASIQDLLAGDITRLDDRAAHLVVSRDDGRPVRAALLYDVSSFGTYLLYGGADVDPATATATTAAAPASARVSLTIAADTKPQVRDPFAAAAPAAAAAGAPASVATPASSSATTAGGAGASRPGTLDVTGFVREREAQRSTFVAPLLPRPLIVDFRDALGDAIGERNDVTGRTLPSVGEIVARHQQVQAAQDAALDHYTASARMEQHFRPSVADPGYDVVTENRFYVDRGGVEWEELTFSVNGSTWTSDRPPFPLLQPEKVLSVPLTLRLTDDYTYRLDGTSGVDGHECYVVRFDPRHAASSLYRGTIWIDTTTYAQRRLQAVQTKLSAPVVSNEETHDFTAVGRINGREIILPTRMGSRQIVLVAGRNMLVEKTTTFDAHRLNGDDFLDRRQAARVSDRIMYRDTERGVRYYVKEGGQRVVSERSTTSAKAMAMGVTLDPSYDFPLPIFGINYLDFDFGGPDSQLALLFGGVLALGNVQRPKLFGTPLDGSVDFFAIAVPGSDRIYDATGEHEDERILTWPVSTGANVGYQISSFQKLTAQYQFRFDGYVRDRTTSEDYVLPKSTTTHGIGLAYEYRRRGYSLTGNGTWYGRARWAPWGRPEALQATPRTFEKYSVNLSKDWYFGLFQKIHANGAYFGGRGLDRFSQYQFGLFDDTRIHGVPASGVRMSELAMARGSYTFNLFEQYRFDLFLEQAFGRDRAQQTAWEPITGLGVALNVKGPWNTILRVDAGQSFLPDRYRHNGSRVLQVLLLKPLK